MAARKKKDEQPPAEGPQQVSAVEEPSAEPEHPAEPVNVRDVAQVYFGIFYQLAYQRMGLHADAMTGGVVRDLGQAKLAVDLAAAIGEALLPSMDENFQREVRNAIMELRLNFARQGVGPASE